MGKSIFFAGISLVLLTVASYASNVDVDVLPTPQNSNSIHSIIQSQKRHVLFNSRRLEGECLPTCIVESQESDPTPEPVVKPPVPAPVTAPVPDPVPAPVTAPVPDPVPAPVTAPVPDPVPAPVTAPTSGCTCNAGDESIGSFKCGKKIYVCPELWNVDEPEICSNEVKNQLTQFKLTAAECATMRTKEIGDDCILLPEFGVTDVNGLGLSHRTCYDGDGNTRKTEQKGCEPCNSLAPVKSFKDPVNKRWFF